MKIGIVCPYSFDVPGGVQFHIRDLTEELIRRGHTVSVLAPGEIEDDPEWFVGAGSAIPIRFNGSVARLSFGPIVASRVRKWLKEGNFDVIHIHEPGSPSLGLLALMNADSPVVATFHASLDRSVVRQLTSGLLYPFFERISARIAVSNEARRTLIEHHAGDAVIIPNGVYTEAFAAAEPIPQWEATDDKPVVVFLGRLDEPRKGLDVFAASSEPVLEKYPGARFLVAGRGHGESIDALQKRYPQNVEVLGEITDEEKQSLLKGATIYVAPQLGGESFGIVLVEAMAAATTVVASDIAAFVSVLDEGESGVLFRTGDSKALTAALLGQLDNPDANAELARIGQAAAARFDWKTVTDRILSVYQAVVPSGEPHPTETAYELVRSKLGKGRL